MDLARAFDATPRRLVDRTEILHATGQTFTLSGLVASAGQPFRVTRRARDDRGLALVNDLDLEVSVGGLTYLGNVFSGAKSAPGGAADIKNNVESWSLPTGPPATSPSPCAPPTWPATARLETATHRSGLRPGRVQRQ